MRKALFVTAIGTVIYVFAMGYAHVLTFVAPRLVRQYAENAMIAGF